MFKKYIYTNYKSFRNFNKIEKTMELILLRKCFVVINLHRIKVHKFTSILWQISQKLFKNYLKIPVNSKVANYISKNIPKNLPLVFNYKKIIY